MASGSSIVAFPVTESGAQLVQPARGPHLPFRRISLPTAPTVLHRNSVVSVSSFEDTDGSPLRAARFRRPRPPSVESPMRRQRRRDGSSRPMEDASRLAKARKIVDEFHETERAYVKGLEMIYSHFLIPIIESLDTPQPLLDRTSINSIFSNFIDIWNLHRSFLLALDALLEKHRNGPLPLSSLLLSHFPYLSLYTPFVTAFPSIIGALTEISTPPTSSRPNPRYNATFSDFLSQQEADPRCGKLKLRDWLLTVVQRCPRYLLLLKDLISSTSTDDPEHAQLTVVHGLVSKKTLQLLALQRATSGLPLQLISPGRHLVKRGSLLQVERNSLPRPREFLLFSDCLIWLSPGDSWDWESFSGWNSSGSNPAPDSSSSSAPPPRPPPLLRNRSRSEAELPRVSNVERNHPPSVPSTPTKYDRRQSYHTPSPVPPPMAKRRGASASDERWVYRGKVDLIDIDVTVGSVLTEEYRFEILNPEESFVVYAESEQSRHEWVTQIRQAKSHLLESLNATNPNSTLTSSSSTNHIRRSLQALPFHPSDDRLATLRPGSQLKSLKRSSKAAGKEAGERRRKVDHWVPPVWIPDGKTNECMRCGKLFGWRRRRHHCRLCGRCVCNACSGRTFFIADASGKKEATKPARACDACYESIFPVIDSSSSNMHEGGGRFDDSITSLSKMPSWFSMPSIPTEPAQPQALMAIDSHHGPDASTFEFERPRSPEEKEPPGVIRLRPHQKLKSYHEILEDFEAHERGDPFEEVASPAREDPGEWVSDVDDEERREEYLRSRLFTPTPPHSLAPSPQTSPMKRKEDTVRRRKRFSLPAVALQTTQVTARASLVIEDETDETDSETPSRPRRFSLVLSPSKSGYGIRNSVSEAVREEDEGEGAGKSLAADKLSELLNRRTRD
ncbi:hypothetical protein D9611_008166 [Ephemerocybe angulata]|uniref:Uncharacterized protein n=1 Tax=Ephemerocybe angulata TaxID=980116 RepID=A0A8H5BZ78_9AGAR|nr:hypothetical protein D9611_008166 [Tulosesus angulatus]